MLTIYPMHVYTDSEFETQFDLIFNHLKKIHSLNRNFLFILDDTSILEWSGISQGVIAKSLTRLAELVSQEDRMIVSSTVYENSVLLNYIEYCCDVCIRMTPLKTGATKEIHGQIHVKEENSIKHLHYVLQDAKVCLFAPGFAKSVL